MRALERTCVFVRMLAGWYLCRYLCKCCLFGSFNFFCIYLYKLFFSTSLSSRICLYSIYHSINPSIYLYTCSRILFTFSLYPCTLMRPAYAPRNIVHRTMHVGCTHECSTVQHSPVPCSLVRTADFQCITK